MLRSRISNTIPGWVVTQEKAFTRWANSQLKSQEIEPISNLAKDLCNGVKLIQLLEIIGGESLGRYYKSPRLLVQKAENVNTALQFIKQRGVLVCNIGAEDIIDGNLKLILGLIWVLILRFTISDINEEGFSAKEGLLLWCQRKTATYKGVDIKDFSLSWQDGRAFCALLDCHRPDLMDYDKLDFSDPRKTISLVLKLASDEIDIPQLLDVEDICDVTKPDERSVMTYVAYWFHAFSELDKIEVAGRRLEKFVDITVSALEMQHDYETRVKGLMDVISKQQNEWQNVVFEEKHSLAVKRREQLKTFKNEIKRAWLSEKSDLASLLGNIRVKLGTYSLKDYSPPEGLKLSDLEKTWSALLRHEGLYIQRLNKEFRNIKDALSRAFGEKANEFADTLQAVALQMNENQDELEQQLIGITEASEQLKSMDLMLHHLKKLDDECINANVEENDYTVYSYEELAYELALIQKSVVKKLSFIENQIIARSVTQLSPVQLEEFESVFRFFDKTNTNSLNESEFSEALASLGMVYSDEEIHDIFLSKVDSTQFKSDIEKHESLYDKLNLSELSLETRRTTSSLSELHSDEECHTRSNSIVSLSSSHSQSPTSRKANENLFGSVASNDSRCTLFEETAISFEKFIEFLIETTEDKNTASQVFQSFVDVASGKTFITELDLKSSLIPDDILKKLVLFMPKNDKGYDYIAYLEKLTGTKINFSAGV